MTSANLDLVRSIFAAFERGDYSSAEWAHPEIEFVIADGPAPGRWTGLVGMANAWRDRLSAWEDIRGNVDEYRELDDEHVLVLQRRTGRAKARASSSERSERREQACFTYATARSSSSPSTGTATARSRTSDSHPDATRTSRAGKRGEAAGYQFDNEHQPGRSFIVVMIMQGSALDGAAPSLHLSEGL